MVRPQRGGTPPVPEETLIGDLTNHLPAGEGRPRVMSLPSHTGSLASLRLDNRMRVIDVLRRRGAVSRAQIARDAGISRTTVGSLVSDLIADGFVTERTTDDGPRGPEGGRPGVLLALDRSAGALVGIDFGHRHLRIAVADLAYEVLVERHLVIELDHAGFEGLDAAAALVEELLAEAGVDPTRVLAAGMGLPAPVERPSGLVRSRGILPSLDDVDAILISGSRHNSFDNDPWILKLVDYTEAALATNRTTDAVGNSC